LKPAQKQKAGLAPFSIEKNSEIEKGHKPRFLFVQKPA